MPREGGGHDEFLERDVLQVGQDVRFYFSLGAGKKISFLRIVGLRFYLDQFKVVPFFFRMSIRMNRFW